MQIRTLLRRLFRSNRRDVVDRFDGRFYPVGMMAMQHHTDEQYKECRGYPKADRDRVVIAAETEDRVDGTEEVASCTGAALSGLNRSPRDIRLADTLLGCGLRKRCDHRIDLRLRNTGRTRVFEDLRADRLGETGRLSTRQERDRENCSRTHCRELYRSSHTLVGTRRFVPGRKHVDRSCLRDRARRCPGERVTEQGVVGSAGDRTSHETART